MTEIKKGQAGRTNYGAWDRLATELVDKTEQEELEEVEQAKRALGLDGKYARSQSEAEEREKNKKLMETKEKLENFKKREAALVQSIAGLLDSPVEEKQEARSVRISRSNLEDGKRVIAVCDTSGNSRDDEIILTSDLSALSSPIPINQGAKSYDGDAENNAPEPTTAAVFGLIKVNIENVQNCTVVIESKIISGTVEIHQCKNVAVRFTNTCAVATVQVDQCEGVSLFFTRGGKFEPSIYHAAVSNMDITVTNTASGKTLQTSADYLRDGAVSVGNATPEEYRFVTQIVKGELLTEHVVQTAGGRVLTEREVKEAQQKRDQIQATLMAKAESMIQMKDKDGNPLVTKTPTATANQGGPDMTDCVQRIVTSCEEDKAAGNEAFGAGEYAQAILQYSLAIDKSDELPSSKSHRVPKDILLSNRAACFLKLGEYAKASADAKKALEINPDNVKALFRHGLSLHAAGQYREAAPILSKAQEKEPKNKQIKQALQFCEVRIAQDYQSRMMG